MKQNREFMIEKNEPLFEFLLASNPDCSRKDMKKFLVHGSIFVNGKSITKYDYPLKKGYKVEIRTSLVHHKIMDKRLSILYEDKDLVIVDKPSGLLSIATENENEETLYRLVSDYVKQQNPKQKIFIIHRLDKDTSGILLFSKNEKMKHLLQENWNELVMIRSYIAIVEGHLKQEEGRIENYLNETSSYKVYVTNRTGDGKLAITHYRKIKENKDYTWVELQLETGRKNQIRVHMQELGNPVLGDKKYGATKNPFRRLALHANRIVFKNPITKEKIVIECPLPKVMR